MTDRRPPTKPRWLNDTEQAAWRAFIRLLLVGMPELERTFKQFGLVHIEYGILAGLSESPNGLRLSRLADAVNVSPSRLTHRMHKLSERGLVVERPCPGDNRATMAYITDEGRALVEQLAPLHVEDVRRMLFDNLDETQTKALADALRTATRQNS